VHPTHGAARGPEARTGAPGHDTRPRPEAIPSQLHPRAALQDFFCLASIGIRVGYPSPALLRPFSRAERRRVRGRIVLALTSNRYYALRGVHPGTRLATVARRLRLGSGFQLGRNRWYLAPNGPSRAVLKVRPGTIQEVGIADTALTRGPGAQRRFFQNLP